ncbi:uncharacterized membrane protein YoaT (DUF817 family) [Sulfitobacter undariae]|uniref:Uncharacterized membrane protein YoaT (DUF817 family) n=1 Tax=Sulfitobacter undariae TaxID=1563671 RepID=A0A7W6E3M0_9RHOB|nr:DUF817 domain-containing protein [Sulfitobacter undariae]MBB3993669.1 uncharacterized membrane protein YoaT (DUF817 family) [Sulfitobacter undariae]
MKIQQSTRQIERRLGDATRRILPRPVAELIMFTLKQAWACLFAALMLGGLIVSDLIWDDAWVIQRYDALFVYAISLQVLFLIFKLESLTEARVILLFHITGTAMEIYKVKMGSWAYPEPGFFKLWGVPLFSGFMYASVGSFMARVIRIFDMRFAPYPPFWMTFILGAAIYLNFFTHHYIFDIRLLLFAATFILFIRTRVWFRIAQKYYWMPLPVAAFFTSFFLWVAENVGTGTGTWVYAGTDGLSFVSLAKMGSWYLLLYVSFVTVTLVTREALIKEPISNPKIADAPSGKGRE